MEIIPVIDIKGGHVVHARGGRRDEYRPIETPLAAGSEPAQIARGLLAFAPFRQLYIADLDAIEARDPNDDAIERIAEASPGVELWIDNGASRPDFVQRWLQRWPHVLVLGSESQSDRFLIDATNPLGRTALSLDFRGSTFQGPDEIRTDPSCWPTRIIAMTLSQVGAGNGPDFARIAEIVAQAGNRRVYAAGGVRGIRDLLQLKAQGVAGALVATALHTGTLTRDDLNEFARH